jgi:hypothetical protein
MRIKCLTNKKLSSVIFVIFVHPLLESMLIFKRLTFLVIGKKSKLSKIIIMNFDL